MCRVFHIDLVKDFAALQRGSLPFAHTHITVTVPSTGVDLNGLMTRSGLLSDHTAHYDNTSRTRPCDSPVNFNRIDKE